MLSALLQAQKYLKRLLRWFRDVNERKTVEEVKRAALFREAMFERKRNEKIETLDLSDVEVRLQALKSVGLSIDLVEIEDLGGQAFLLNYRVARSNE